MSTHADNFPAPDFPNPDFPRPGRKFLLFTLTYIVLIPFINWSFTWAPMVSPFPALGPGWAFNPVTIVTGLVLVVRDFAQREVGHWVLLAMLIALLLTAWFAGPELALASGVAFAISEIVDYALFTFTKYKLSTRVLLSSALAAPLDTTVFLWGAEQIRPDQLTAPNIIMSIAGKMAGALVIWWIVIKVEGRVESRSRRPSSAQEHPSSPEN